MVLSLFDITHYEFVDYLRRYDVVYQKKKKRRYDVFLGNFFFFG